MILEDFFDSKGIDVFKNADDSGKAYSIELLNETTAITSRASASAYQEIIAHEDVLYVGQGHNVYYSSDGGETPGLQQIPIQQDQVLILQVWFLKDIYFT